MGTKRLRSAAAGLAITMLLAGCSSSSSYQYEKLDAAMSSIKPSEIGVVEAESRYGPESYLSTQAPTVATVISGEDVYEVTQDRLDALGFENTSGDEWRKGSGDGVVSVSVRDLTPGERIAIYGGQPVYIAETQSVAIYVSKLFIDENSINIAE